MSAHKQQAAFLKALIVQEDCEEYRELRDRILRMEREEKCIWRATWLVAIVALVGWSGLGYLAVLLPEFFQNSSHVLIKVFAALALGSMICLLVFVGLWAWQRTLVNRAHEEGRRCFLARQDSRIQVATNHFAKVGRKEPRSERLKVECAHSETLTESVSLPKGS